MSSRYTKIKYKEEGTYGSIEEHWIYCADIGSVDVTTFYDEFGVPLFSFNNTIDGNMLDKIIELYHNWDPDKNPNVKRVTKEEFDNLYKNL